jgi:hypothetical protein
MSTVPSSVAAPEPWYHVGVMWLFVGGLGTVVIGSFMLLGTAIQHADVELHAIPMKPASYYRATPAVEATGKPAQPDLKPAS